MGLVLLFKHLTMVTVQLPAVIQSSDSFSTTRVVSCAVMLHAGQQWFMYRSGALFLGCQQQSIDVCWSYLCTLPLSAISGALIDFYQRLFRVLQSVDFMYVAVVAGTANAQIDYLSEIRRHIGSSLFLRTTEVSTVSSSLNFVQIIGDQLEGYLSTDALHCFHIVGLRLATMVLVIGGANQSRIVNYSGPHMNVNRNLVRPRF